MSRDDNTKTNQIYEAKNYETAKHAAKASSIYQ